MRFDSSTFLRKEEEPGKLSRIYNAKTNTIMPQSHTSKIWFSPGSKISAMALILVLGLTSCGNLRHKALVPLQIDKEMKSVGLFNHYMAPPQMPETPVAAASKFNKKTDSISAQINDLLEKRTEAYYQTLAGKLAGHTGLEVKAGEELKEGKRYDMLLRRAEPEALKFKGKGPFREIKIPESTFNPVEFDSEDLVYELTENTRARSSLRRMPRPMGVNGLAVGQAKIKVSNVDDYGRYAQAQLQVNVILYNDRGNVVGHGYGETEKVKVSGDKRAEFASLMDEYSSLLEKVLQKMTEEEA